MELRRPFGRMLIAPALLIAVALAGLGASGGGDYQLQFDAKLAKQKPTGECNACHQLGNELAH